ncbi:MAG: aminoacetone oxidase family FAD-binding enzyme [Oscillospiraceae bacterium]|nr:aminoacetone oxidase family FAD-binding enzyme [Oscillospiraceae bacterium]
MVIGIIGGGASGMAAALAASENPNVRVILLERQARVGRKLLATGNGRCNLTNLQADGASYHGNTPDFATYALQKFPPWETIQWFENMGLYTVAEPSGRVYPYSDQANSVVDILRLNLMRPNVELKTGFEVQKIKRNGSGFEVSNGEETFCLDKIIIACGGLAGSKLGGTMSGYKLLGKLGHKSTKLRPALVQLKSDWGGLAGLKGVRAECYAEIYHDQALMCQSRGELQFTEYGLSGPVIFEISRDVCTAPGSWLCKLDLLPDWEYDRLCSELLRRKNTDLPVQELLTGILHNRLGRVLTHSAGVPMNGLCRELNGEDIQAVCRAVKGFEICLTEPMGMDSAQVTAGGVLTEQFDPNTMESRLVPGLYACGEVLDIDGDCGGYNLQWAWSSGRLAGIHAGKDAK